jgi:WD40 repeat protein/tetratricopeptide (TPR) repeat protein
MSDHPDQPTRTRGAADRPTAAFEARDTDSSPTGPPDIPGYDIAGEIGRGGMGVVYKARHLALNRDVALKVIADGPAVTPARLVRFRQEAEAVARLQHPNIVQIYEVGAAAGCSFLALEYVDGGTLRDKVAGVQQPARDTARLVETLARAVHHAHERRIVHRDLKPSNVLLTGGGVPKVADFGLARFLDAGAGLSQTTDFLGTPAYSAPEQVRNRAHDIGPATDVYALGATLYELLTGRPPFDSASVPETLRAVAETDPVPVRRLRPDCPRDLETIALKCLQKDPRARYPSAAELADDLHRFLADEPIRARPVGPLGRLGRWARRNPQVAGLLGTVAGLLLVIAVGGVGLSVRLGAALRQSERDREQSEKDRGQAEADRDTARRAQREARERLLESQVAEARARRFGGRPGQRTEALARIRQAVELARELGEPPAAFDELRDLAVAIALPDLGRVRTIPVNPGGAEVHLDPHSLTRYAVADKRDGLAVRRLADDAELARLRPSPPDRFQFLAFTPDRDAALVYDAAGGHLSRWHFAGVDPRPLAKLPCRPFRAELSRDGGRVLVLGAEPDGAKGLPIEVCELPSGRRVGGWHLATRLTVSLAHENVSMDPTGRYLALVPGQYGAPDNRRVLVYDVDAGKVVAEAPQVGNSKCPVWHPDGETVAVGLTDSNNIVLLHVPTKTRVQVLRDQRGGSPALQLGRGGDLLASTSTWSGGVLLWHPFTGKLLLRDPNEAVILRTAAADGRLAGTKPGGGGVEVWAAEPSPVLRTFAPHPARGLVGDLRRPAVHPGGRLLAVGTSSGAILIDAATGLDVGRVTNASGVFPAFDPRTGDLFTHGGGSLVRWAVRFDPADPTRVTVGPPRPVLELPVASTPIDHQITVSRDGRVIARAASSVAYVLTADGSRPPVTLGPFSDVRNLAVSPDGRWVVTGTHPDPWANDPDRGVRVWDAATGRLLRTLSPTGGYVAVSPDGRWLHTSQDQTVWRTDTWEVAYTLPDGAGRPAAFAPDGHVLAIGLRTGAVGLVEAVTGRTLAVLENPDQARVWGMAFSPDGARLYLGSKDQLVAYAWDLRALRRELKALGLDWGAPDYPPPSDVPAAGRPLRAEVVGAGLIADAPARFRHLYESAVLAVADNPLDPAAHHRLALELLRGPKAADARRHLTVALALRPDHHAARAARSVASMRLGRRDEAVADATAVLAAVPGHVQSRLDRATACKYLGRFAEAADDLTELLRVYPRSVDFLVRRSSAYQFAGRPDLAAADIRAADALYRPGVTAPTAVNNLAWRLANGPPMVRNPKRALELLGGGLPGGAGNPAYLNTLGVVQYRNGQYREAITTLEKSRAVGRGRYDGFDLYFLAMAQARLGEAERARAAYAGAVAWAERQKALPADQAAELAEFRAEAEGVLRKAGLFPEVAPPPRAR